MNVDYMIKLLRRLKKAEFVQFLQKWGRLPDTSAVFVIKSSSAKHQLVSTALTDCKKAGITASEMDEFDLLYLHHHSRSKIWTAYKVDKDSDDTSQKSLAPVTMKKRLYKELRKYFSARVSLHRGDGAFWMRLVICEGGVRSKESITYAVYYPHGDYYYASTPKASVAGYISQAFGTVLGGPVRKLNLEGRCIRSLAMLTLGKDAQGSFSKYKLNQVDPNPLATLKRKRQDDEDEDLDEHITNENVKSKRRRHVVLKETFGSNPQPTLERVTYWLETPFAGLQHAPAMSTHEGAFNCRVRFEGRSVIEGMRELGRAGLADLPMRRLVGSIQTAAVNTFLLRAKKRKGAGPATRER